MLLSQEELAFGDAQAKQSSQVAELKTLRAKHEALEARARRLAGVDPAGSAEACRQLRALEPVLNSQRLAVRQAEAEAERLRPAAERRRAKRLTPRAAHRPNRSTEGAGARARAALEAYLAERGG